ncbi:MAG: bifunctional ornithine acetyltransferase/N-acetylglutamate synthase, partial [bacterium]
MKKKKTKNSKNSITEITAGLEAVRGISAAGVACGLKEKGGLDLALFASDRPCTVAAFFTRNRLIGAHIEVCRAHLKHSGNRAMMLIVNSGCANCATGKHGVRDAELVVKKLSRLTKLPTEQVLIGSTGLIGTRLPAEKIVKKLPELISGLSKSDSRKAAEAIMTTDTRPKMCAVKVKTAEGTYHIAGVAKGAGMIAPNLATQFAFIFTDADVPQTILRSISRRCVDESFNSIIVDGDTSPNDTVFVFANGASGVQIVDCGVRNSNR